MFRLDELANRLNARFRGDPATQISRVGTLERARVGDIAFLANRKYAAHLKTCRASAVIVSAGDADHTDLPVIIATNPYVAFARVAQWLNPEPVFSPAIHPTAVVEGVVPESVYVGAHAVIEQGAQIGENVIIGPGSVVGKHAKIGVRTKLHANVTIYHDCELGSDCIIHSGAVIGSDGFGFARDTDGTWIKIPQVGRVVIGDNVEIGANTTIDRGAIEDTVIDSGVKIDNLVQIGHNTTVGEKAIIAGCAGIAGSTHIGKRTMLGGGVGTAGHLSIADDAVISGGTNVPKTVSEPGVYTAVLPLQRHSEWVRNFAYLRKLDVKFKTIDARFKALESPFLSSNSESS